MQIHIPQDFIVYLQTFDMPRFNLPNSDRLFRELSFAEMNDLMQPIEGLAFWLPLLQSWSDPFGIELQQLAGSLKTLTDKFRRGWLDAYQAATKSSKVKQTEPDEFQSIKVKIKDKKIIRQLRESLEITRPFVNKFRNHVNEANRFVTKYDTASPSPDDSSFPLYSRLQEIAYNMPDLLVGIEPGRLILYPNDLVNILTNPTLIVGPAGYGKTSYCRVNTINDIEKITTGESRRIPIYVPLFRLAQGPIGTFEETFFRTSELHRFLAESPNDDWSFRLYLDGLDEVAELERQIEILKLVKEGKERHPGLQIVIDSARLRDRTSPCSVFQTKALRAK
jgi:hypothetical protein